MAANKMDEILKRFPDLEEGWKEMEEKLKTEPAEREMLSLKYREMLQREKLKENLPEPEFTKAKRVESDSKVMKANAQEKIYILVGIYTPNDHGAYGNICDFLMFDSKEKAIERLQREIEGNTDKSVSIEEINVGDEQGRIVAECDYTADWTGDYYQYEIREIDIEEIGLKIK